MNFYFALFHFNKCYHHRLEWKKVMKTKKSVLISSRSTIQLTATQCDVKSFLNLALKKWISVLKTGSLLWLRLARWFLESSEYPGIWRLEKILRDWFSPSRAFVAWESLPESRWWYTKRSTLIIFFSQVRTHRKRRLERVARVRRK